MTTPPDPAGALRRIAFLLERAGAPTYRARSFRRAAEAIEALSPEELRLRWKQGRLQDLAGVGPVTAAVISEALEGKRPAYLAELEGGLDERTAEGAVLQSELHAALRGDCHVHSDWSDGRASMRAMAEAARALGRDYVVLTDHSPRLTIANGLSAERLEAQLEAVAALNAELAPFRVLTGIEVDILADGALDQTPELLARLDVVVGSVHSQLRMESRAMTARLEAALANPHLDVLGHCTGRMRTAKRDRPESTFDGERVLQAAVTYDKAIEVNSRLERNNPPRTLLARAVALGCRFAIDSDAHVPGELDWLAHGAARAAECNVTPERVVNTWSAEQLLEWTAAHEPLRVARGVAR